MNAQTLHFDLETENMAYGRRDINHYQRGVNPNALPSSYRNKAILIIGATALYTAFLYHSGR